LRVFANHSPEAAMKTIDLALDAACC